MLTENMLLKLSRKIAKGSSKPPRFADQVTQLSHEDEDDPVSMEDGIIEVMEE